MVLATAVSECGTAGVALALLRTVLCSLAGPALPEPVPRRRRPLPVRGRDNSCSLKTGSREHGLKCVPNISEVLSCGLVCRPVRPVTTLAGPSLPASAQPSVSILFDSE